MWAERTGPATPEITPGIPADVVEPYSSSKGDGSPTIDEKHPIQYDLSAAAAAEDIPKLQKSHQWDPNLPLETIDALRDATQTGDVEKINEVESVFAENSPYEEVRAAVRNTDGGEIANTVRAWILGMIFVTAGSGLNMFLSMRFARARRSHVLGADGEIY